MCYVDTDSYLDQLADQYWGDDFILVEDHKCECCDSIFDAISLLYLLTTDCLVFKFNSGSLITTL